MEMFADVRQVLDCLDEPFACVPRVRAGEADSGHAWDRINLSQELCEVAVRIIWSLIVIDDLPKELDLRVA